MRLSSLCSCVLMWLKYHYFITLLTNISLKLNLVVMCRRRRRRRWFGISVFFCWLYSALYCGLWAPFLCLFYVSLAVYCHSIHVSLLWLFLCPSASLPLPILTTNDLKIINICCGAVRYNGLLASIMLFTSCHFLLSAHMGWWWCGYITATHKCVHKFVVYDCPACIYTNAHTPNDRRKIGFLLSIQPQNENTFHRSAYICSLVFFALKFQRRRRYYIVQRSSVRSMRRRRALRYTAYTVCV